MSRPHFASGQPLSGGSLKESIVLFPVAGGEPPLWPQGRNWWRRRLRRVLMNDSAVDAPGPQGQSVVPTGATTPALTSLNGTHRPKESGSGWDMLVAVAFASCGTRSLHMKTTGKDFDGQIGAEPEGRLEQDVVRTARRVTRPVCAALIIVTHSIGGLVRSSLRADTPPREGPNLVPTIILHHHNNTAPRPQRKAGARAGQSWASVAPTRSCHSPIKRTFPFSIPEFILRPL